MYTPHPIVETPPDDARLWRYMDLSRFLQMLHSKSLYFCRKRELEDKWEAVLSAARMKLIRGLAGTFSGAEDRAVEALVQVHQEACAEAAISCWHSNHDESVAMWRLYTAGADGVAIQTTVGRLKSALKDDPRPILIGSIKYTDYSLASSGATLSGGIHLNALSPLFEKRRSFRHESEVRAVIPDAEEPSYSLEDVKSLLERGRGVLVPVDLSSLIQRIVVSKDYQGWAVPSLQKAVADAGLSVEVELSDLLKEPQAAQGMASSI